MKLASTSAAYIEWMTDIENSYGDVFTKTWCICMRKNNNWLSRLGLMYFKEWHSECTKWGSWRFKWPTDWFIKLGSIYMTGGCVWCFMSDRSSRCSNLGHFCFILQIQCNNIKIFFSYSRNRFWSEIERRQDCVLRYWTGQTKIFLNYCFSFLFFFV